MEKTSEYIAKSLEPVEKFTQKNIVPIMTDPTVATILIWLAVMNIMFSVNDVPEQVKSVMKSQMMTLVLTFLTAFLVSKNITSSLVTTLVIMLSFYVLKIAFENFEIISPTTDSMPQCVDVKVEDLVKLFDGDSEKLKKAMYAIGIPANVDLTDRNAPLIATYLVNSGYESVSEKCKVPQ